MWKRLAVSPGTFDLQLDDTLRALRELEDRTRKRAGILSSDWSGADLPDADEGVPNRSPTEKLGWFRPRRAAS
jgi:hypothetical protein